MSLDDFVSEDLQLVAGGVPSGFDAMLLADAAGRAFADGKRPVLHITSDDGRLATLANAVAFFAPDLEIIKLPAWDCLPYDRVSPQADIVAERMAALSRLSNKTLKAPRLVLTTVNAALQRVAPIDAVKKATFHAEPGDTVEMVALTEFLASTATTAQARSWNRVNLPCAAV